MAAAIAAGVADPARIAIMGGSYGGYSTLFALGHSAQLYRCGISMAGVTDWIAFLDDSDIAEYKSASRHWREQLGGELPVLNLPTDHPRPPVQTFNGRIHTTRLDAPLVEKLKALAQAQGHGLLPEVGQLPARDFVLVDAACGAGQTGLERGVHAAHGFPVGLQGADVGKAQAGIALGVGQGCDQRRGGRLARGSGQGR